MLISVFVFKMFSKKNLILKRSSRICYQVGISLNFLDELLFNKSI